jgi:hypothetical protein
VDCGLWVMNCEIYDSHTWSAHRHTISARLQAPTNSPSRISTAATVGEGRLRCARLLSLTRNVDDSPPRVARAARIARTACSCRCMALAGSLPPPRLPGSKGPVHIPEEAVAGACTKGRRCKAVLRVCGTVLPRYTAPRPLLKIAARLLS